jgi:hypothetical protein
MTDSYLVLGSVDATWFEGAVTCLEAVPHMADRGKGCAGRYRHVKLSTLMTVLAKACGASCGTL